MGGLVNSQDFAEIIEALRKRYGVNDPPAHVSDADPFHVLIGAVLSHRTRDENTDKAYRHLFNRFKNPAELAQANVKAIEKLIKPVGFYRQKARRIKKLAKIIFEERGGIVPSTREELMSLPGVGPKSADIVLSIAFRKPEVAVDTHVETVAKRLGIADEDDGYEEVKRKITALTKTEHLPFVNLLFVRFGREICRKPKPKCMVCPITSYCRYYKNLTSKSS